MNTHTHCMALATGVGVRPAGMLRHSDSHRAKLRTIAAGKFTTICARFEPGFMDEDCTVRDLTADLARWANDKGGSLIRAMSEKAGPSITSPFGGVRCMQVFSVRGPVTLPAKVKGWILTKATAEEIAWSKR